MLSHKLITTETGIGQIKAPQTKSLRTQAPGQTPPPPDKNPRNEIIMQSYYILLY
jgi:hypothetical protein